MREFICLLFYPGQAGWGSPSLRWDMNIVDSSSFRSPGFNAPGPLWRYFIWALSLQFYNNLCMYWSPPISQMRIEGLKRIKLTHQSCTACQGEKIRNHLCPTSKTRLFLPSTVILTNSNVKAHLGMLWGYQGCRWWDVRERCWCPLEELRFKVGDSSERGPHGASGQVQSLGSGCSDNCLRASAAWAGSPAHPHPRTVCEERLNKADRKAHGRKGMSQVHRRSGTAVTLWKQSKDMKFRKSEAIYRSSRAEIWTHISWPMVSTWESSSTVCS